MGKKIVRRQNKVLKGAKCSERRRIDWQKMKCSAVVYRARYRAGRTGTEMLEWRADRRNLSVLGEKITDIISVVHPPEESSCIEAPGTLCDVRIA